MDAELRDIEFGLIGGSLGHSYSPEIHAMLGGYSYDLIELAPDELPDFFAARRFGAVNITIPHKVAAVRYMDELSPEAGLLGNVNTVINDNGRLIGHNTDMFGLTSLFRAAGADLSAGRAAVLGGGGAGRTAHAVLCDLGANSVRVVSRSGEYSYDDLYRDAKDIDIIVNATPVGMYPGNGQAPVDIARFPSCAQVVDLIYNPRLTRLMLDCEARGVRASGGLWMLVAQAARARELFTGQPASDADIGRAYSAMLDSTLNIVLVGMPGCGKSAIGAAVAKLTGRRLFDTDEEIERTSGCSIEEIFTRHGEAHFRALEREAIERAGREHSLIIATGGGAVLDRANIDNLRQNGVIIHISRPFEHLAVEGRPLSADADGLARLYAGRLPVYMGCRDAEVDNVGTIDGAARAALEVFHEITHNKRP